MKIALIFGTRPEAIKLAPVYYALKNQGCDLLTVSSGQHREMLNQALELFEIKVDYDLQVMSVCQNLSDLTEKLISKIDKIIRDEKLDYIIVQGDTTTAFMGALIGVYYKIPVAHVEAGLRTNDIYNPFPEEINRRAITVMSSIHFAPTINAKNNLLKEGVSEDKILLTGNTIIDSLFWVKEKYKKKMKEIRKIYSLNDKKYILMTMHRRENWGKPMENVLAAVKRYLIENKDTYLVFPVHLNPYVNDVVHAELKGVNNAVLLEPLNYLELLSLMEGSYYIMTDSGGIQEEATAFNKFVLVLRKETERQEIIEAGIGKLVGTETKKVYESMKEMEDTDLEDIKIENNPFGDGKASERIATYLLRK